MIGLSIGYIVFDMIEDMTPKFFFFFIGNSLIENYLHVYKNKAQSNKALYERGTVLIWKSFRSNFEPSREKPKLPIYDLKICTKEKIDVDQHVNLKNLKIEFLMLHGSNSKNLEAV